MFGFETAGLSSKDVFFTLPVELYILARYTLGAENGTYSVLEIVAQNSEIRLDQIGPEYPTPERTKVVFEQVNYLLLSVQQQVAVLKVERERHLDQLKQLEVANYIAGKACEILAELSAEVDDTGAEAQAIMCEWDTSGSSAGEAAARRAAASRKAGGL
jgi:hypothetical protein